LWGGWELNPQGGLPRGILSPLRLPSSATAPGRTALLYNGLSFSVRRRSTGRQPGFCAGIRPDYHPDGLIRLPVPVALFMPKAHLPPLFPAFQLREDKYRPGPKRVRCNSIKIRL
jgi:hypothetical protein